jgi:hypothetical protein
MTNQEGMWGVVVILGVLLLVAIPVTIATITAVACGLSMYIKNRNARVAVAFGIMICLLALALLAPGITGLVGLPCFILGGLIACGHAVVFSVFADRFAANKSYVLTFISAFICSAIVVFAYVSITSIPAYLEVLGRLQYILYFAASLLFPAVVFTIASMLRRRRA